MKQTDWNKVFEQEVEQTDWNKVYEKDLEHIAKKTDELLDDQGIPLSLIQVSLLGDILANLRTIRMYLTEEKGTQDA